MQNPLGVSTVGLRVCEDTCMLCVQGQSDAKCPSEEAPVCPRPTRQSQGCAPLPEQRLPPLCRLSAGKWQHHCLGPQQGRGDCAATARGLVRSLGAGGTERDKWGGHRRPMMGPCAEPYRNSSVQDFCGAGIRYNSSTRTCANRPRPKRQFTAP